VHLHAGRVTRLPCSCASHIMALLFEDIWKRSQYNVEAYLPSFLTGSVGDGEFATIPDDTHSMPKASGVKKTMPRLSPGVLGVGGATGERRHGADKDGGHWHDGHYWPPAEHIRERPNGVDWETMGSVPAPSQPWDLCTHQDPAPPPPPTMVPTTLRSNLKPSPSPSLIWPGSPTNIIPPSPAPTPSGKVRYSDQQASESSTALTGSKMLERMRPPQLEPARSGSTLDAGAGVGDISVTEAGSPWRCPQCLMENRSSAAACSLCECPRSASTNLRPHVSPTSPTSELEAPETPSSGGPRGGPSRRAGRLMTPKDSDNLVATAGGPMFRSEQESQGSGTRRRSPGAVTKTGTRKRSAGKRRNRDRETTSNLGSFSPRSLVESVGPLPPPTPTG